MPRSLPATPTIEALKKEAKELLQAHRAGQRSSCDALHGHPRFASKSDDEILSAKLTLQQAQHALAAGYGFNGWKDLTLHVEALASRSRPPATDPASAIVDALLHGAYRGRASDIHLQWVDGRLQGRFRIDGRLGPAEPDIPQELGQSVVARIKALAKLDVSIRDRQQVGHAFIDVGGRELDLRVSVVPFVAGESVVIRLLDKGAVCLDVEQLGFSPDTLAMVRGWISRPNGIILVGGPTGSGATTTLYALLAELNDGQRMIVTAEDPVEFVIPGINQEQIDPSKGITFEQAIGSHFRQDPDVFMVGEIRSLAVAALLVQTALTGHLVLSVLHTNDAAGTVQRLLDMGLEPHLVNSTVIGALAQRLVRMPCAKCVEPYQAPAWMRDRLGDFASAEFRRGKGCPECGGTGYRGRIAIHECLELSEPLKDLIGRNVQGDELRRAAVEAGMVTLRQDGLAKAAQGLTTIEEVLRVTAGVSR